MPIVMNATKYHNKIYHMDKKNQILLPKSHQTSTNMCVKNKKISL